MVSVVRQQGFRRPLGARLGATARSEQACFRLGMGVAAVHVLDDSFLQPEPGTSAGNHLVSGLAPLALIAAAAVAYPRLRAGARATLALTLGLLMVVAGAGEAGYYMLETGLARDDYTGLAAVAGGSLLVVLAGVTLWRSRRLDGRRGRRYLRRALLVVVAAVVGYQLIAVASSYVMTHAARATVPPAMLGTRYEDVVFPASEGVKLAGWYIPSRNGAAVIAFPGREGPQRHARMLARHGYGVLLFDRSGEGASEGDPDGLGWTSDGDVLAAIAYLQARPDVDPDRIGGLGLSTGGEVLLQAAAKSTALKAVVSEGAGVRSIREELELSTAATAVFSNHAPPPNLKDLMGRIAPRSIFLIYAENGQSGEDLNPVFYEAAHEPKTLWEVRGGHHIGGIDASPKQYESRVVAFFNRSLLEPR